MTTPPETDAQERAAHIASALQLGREAITYAHNGHWEQNTISMIETAKTGLTSLLTDSARRDHDFEALRIAYALQAEAVEELKAFVERVDAATTDGNPIFSKMSPEATLFHLGAQARELLSKLAGETEE